MNKKKQALLTILDTKAIYPVFQPIVDLETCQVVAYESLSRIGNKELYMNIEELLNKYFEGPTGMEIMSGIMQSYRKNQPKEFGGLPVVSIRDIKTGFSWNADGSGKTKLDLPESDVLQWRLADGTLVTVRPSGTEPKIKYYILSKTEVENGDLENARKASSSKIEAIMADIKKVLG